MNTVTKDDLQSLYRPGPQSHKGQNGKMLLIGGSELFHAASLWSLTIASRIVDLVHYASVPENNEIVSRAKEEFRNGIVISRDDMRSYIDEDDCVLIGPGMTRDTETQELTNSLLKAYPKKQWVIDAGALQMMDVSLIPEHAILTPHHGEYTRIFGSRPIEEAARKYRCIVLLKGPKDLVSDGTETYEIEGGNSGMTKGGTGDVLAGLIAALSCNNAPLLAAIAGSFINKKAGDELYKTVGPYFNATDLANQIPRTMKEVIIGNTG